MRLIRRIEAKQTLLSIAEAVAIRIDARVAGILRVGTELQLPVVADAVMILVGQHRIDAWVTGFDRISQAVTVAVCQRRIGLVLTHLLQIRQSIAIGIREDQRAARTELQQVRQTVAIAVGSRIARVVRIEPQLQLHAVADRIAIGVERRIRTLIFGLRDHERAQTDIVRRGAICNRILEQQSAAACMHAVADVVAPMRSLDSALAVRVVDVVFVCQRRVGCCRPVEYLRADQVGCRVIDKVALIQRRRSRVDSIRALASRIAARVIVEAHARID